MKDKDPILTLPETEELCRLYMDCSLSVLEETELRYFLSTVDYHSPTIDEVRQVMNIDSYISDKPFVKAGYNGKRMARKMPVYWWSIAASVAILIGIGLSLRNFSSHGSVESQSYYIAYADGHRLSDDAARQQIEAEKRSADDFIKRMSELEAIKQQIIDNFYNP